MTRSHGVLRQPGRLSAAFAAISFESCQTSTAEVTRHILKMALKVQPSWGSWLSSQNGEELALDVVSNVVYVIHKDPLILDEECKIQALVARITRRSIVNEIRKKQTRPLEDASRVMAPMDATAAEQQLRESLVGRGLSFRDKRILILAWRGFDRRHIAERIFGENTPESRHCLRMAVARIRTKLAA